MNAPAVYLYDKSFDGFLCCIFQTYVRKLKPSSLVGAGEQIPALWSQLVRICTDTQEAERVWLALQTRIGEKAADALFRIHFSELEGADNLLFRYILKIFESGASIAGNYADPDVKAIFDIQKRIQREAERVAQFIRFQKTADGIFFAACEPEYNVIPMVLHHFQDRFADQHWMIYDVRRKNGYFYDGTDIQWVSLVSDKLDTSTGELNEAILAPEERLFQDLWKQYFHSICIQERTNLKLHMQKVPKKYWRFLTEKKSQSRHTSENNPDL